MIQLKKDQNQNKILVRDNINLVCPFQAAIPVPGRLGQMSLMHISCSSMCPFFEHDQDNNHVDLKCKEHRIYLEPTEKLESKLIIT
jgi:hypothetical protein